MGREGLGDQVGVGVELRSALADLRLRAAAPVRYGPRDSAVMTAQQAGDGAHGQPVDAVKTPYLRSFDVADSHFKLLPSRATSVFDRREAGVWRTDDRRTGISRSRPPPRRIGRPRPLCAVHSRLATYDPLLFSIPAQARLRLASPCTGSGARHSPSGPGKSADSGDSRREGSRAGPESCTPSRSRCCRGRSACRQPSASRSERSETSDLPGACGYRPPANGLAPDAAA